MLLLVLTGVTRDVYFGKAKLKIYFIYFIYFDLIWNWKAALNVKHMS